MTINERFLFVASLIATFILVQPTGAEAPAQAATKPFKWTKTASQLYVKKAALDHGWSRGEWLCLKQLIERESRWSYKADNKHSTAFGLFQMLKTPKHLSVPQQTERGIRYIEHRYDNPCNAWSVWKKREKAGRPWY